MLITPKAINLPLSSLFNHFSFTLNVPYVPFTLTNLIDREVNSSLVTDSD